jgi:hypothetical protein
VRPRVGGNAAWQINFGTVNAGVAIPTPIRAPLPTLLEPAIPNPGPGGDAESIGSILPDPGSGWPHGLIA